MDKLTKLVADFAEVAAQHYESLQEMNEEKANRLSGRIMQLYAEIRLMGNDGREALLARLESDCPGAAAIVSLYKQTYTTERSRKVLERLACEEDLMGFRARIALERWDKGELQID